MPSTTTYKRGQVVVVNVPFANHSGSKPRPALVISTEAFHRVPSVLSMDKKIIKRSLGRLLKDDLEQVEEGSPLGLGL